MRRFFAALALTSAMSAGVSMPARADVAFSLSIGQPDAYYMGLGNYYGYPRDNVYAITQRGIPYTDLSTLLYIASLAHVDPYMVADLRLSGMSWMDVSHYYGLGADVYYVDATPYGPYTSYYQPFLTTPRSSWVTLSLSDLAIVNLTNLRYASQYYGVPAYDVMRYRARGDNFLTINRTFFQRRGYLPARPVRRAWARPMTLPDRFRAQARVVEQRRNVKAGRREAVREQARIEERRVEQRVERRADRAAANRQAERAQARERTQRTQAREKTERAQAREQTQRIQAREKTERAQAKQRTERAKIQQRAVKQERRAKPEMNSGSKQRQQREMASRRQARARDMAQSRRQMNAQHASRETRQMRSTQGRRTQEARAQKQRPQHQEGRGRGKNQK